MGTPLSTTALPFIRDFGQLIAYYANSRRDVLAEVPPLTCKRALEIGGGDFPTLLEYCRISGAEAWGVDIRDTQHPELTFIRGSIEDDEVAAQLKDGSFDLIFANDVIEHLKDSRRFLSTLKIKLAPNGVLMVSVPNVRQIRTFYHIFVRGTFPRHPSGLFDETHLRWFCRRDIETAARDVGFAVSASVVKGRLVPGFARTWSLSELLGLHVILTLKA